MDQDTQLAMNTTPQPKAPQPPQPEGSWRPGGATLLAVLAGIIAGILLYLPWDTVWNLALRQAATQLSRQVPGLRVDWQTVGRAGPLGFRLNGFSATSPQWLFSPRLAWLDVRLGVTPLFTVTADTGGREATLLFFDSGAFDLQGQVNLGSLGRRDIRGSLDLRGEGLFLRDTKELEKCFLDLRGQSVQLPDSLWLGDVALSLDYKAGALRIRSFTLREPVQVRATGTARLRQEALLHSPYVVSGEVVRGQGTFPFQAEGVLGDFLGSPVDPR